VRETRTLHPELWLTADVDVDESLLDDTVKTVLFRVSQEALANAVRHSQGSIIRLKLTSSDPGVRLTIEDNGSGFSFHDVVHQSMGLESMRERVELVGGQLNIASTPGQGTRIEALVPWPTPGYTTV
jgi:signal transduction histidine kinase